MKKTNINDYRSLMNEIVLPDDIRRSVLERAKYLRNEKSTLPFPISPIERHRPLVRGLALGACTLVLAIGLVIGSSVLPFSNPFVGSNDTENSFALAAYAAGESSQKGQFASLKRDFGTLAGFGWSDNNDMENAYLRKDDPDSSPSDTKGFASVHLFLDLSCVGKNVNTLTYSIEGDGAYFYQENWNYGPPPNTIGPNSDPQIKKNFTIGYDKQAKDKAAIQRQLYLFFPLDEKAREVYDANSEAHGGSTSATSSNENWYRQLEMETFRQFAEEIVRHPITLSATFKDGSTQKKTYLISPTNDFDQQLESYRVSMEEHLDDLSCFFTLTEIAES